jgi:hypothetical protein
VREREREREEKYLALLVFLACVSSFAWISINIHITRE